MKTNQTDGSEQARDERKNRRSVVSSQTRIDAEEKCPVIRANQIFFTGGSGGRTRVVFF